MARNRTRRFLADAGLEHILDATSIICWFDANQRPHLSPTCDRTATPHRVGLDELDRYPQSCSRCIRPLPRRHAYGAAIRKTVTRIRRLEQLIDELEHHDRLAWPDARALLDRSARQIPTYGPQSEDALVPDELDILAVDAYRRHVAAHRVAATARTRAHQTDQAALAAVRATLRPLYRHPDHQLEGALDELGKHWERLIEAPTGRDERARRVARAVGPVAAGYRVAPNRLGPLSRLWLRDAENLYALERDRLGHAERQLVVIATDSTAPERGSWTAQAWKIAGSDGNQILCACPPHALAAIRAERVPRPIATVRVSNATIPAEAEPIAAGLWEPLGGGRFNDLDALAEAARALA